MTDVPEREIVMKNIKMVRDEIAKGMLDDRILSIYVDSDRVKYNRERYVSAIDSFSKLFPEENEIEIYSAPGRSEVCGNHTDHQNGVVLATSINLDTMAVVSKTEDNAIRLVSGDFPMEVIDVADVAKRESEKDTTTALIRGVLAGLKDMGCKLGGFKAYVTSDVIMGAGMSSSAAFESLIGTIISGLYNDMSVSSVDIAKIGQYAENEYFGKPCGLMDQMACSVGGMVYIDFANRTRPAVEKIACNFEEAGLSLCIVDTKGSHADLTPDYAAIPEEMRQVAEYFGKDYLRDVPEEKFYKNLSVLRDKVSDRAVLRAIHFYTEQTRVDEAVSMLRASDYVGFLDVVERSGNSSAKYLQNIYSPNDLTVQNVTVALAVSESVLGQKGVSRVHGGGFAGTIQAFVKNDAVPEYKKAMERIFGGESCHVLKVRAYGGIKVF